MTSVVNIEDRRENIIDRFDDTTFHEPEFMMPLDKLAFHIASDFSDKWRSFLKEVFKDPIRTLR